MNNTVLVVLILSILFGSQSVVHASGAPKDVVNHGYSQESKAPNKKMNQLFISAQLRYFHQSHFSHTMGAGFVELQEHNHHQLRALEVGLAREFDVYKIISTKTQGTIFFGQSTINKNSTRYFSGLQNNAISFERVKSYGPMLAQSLLINIDLFGLTISPFTKVGLGSVLYRHHLSYSVQDLGQTASAFELFIHQNTLTYFWGGGVELKNKEGGILFIEGGQSVAFLNRRKISAKRTNPDVSFYPTKRDQDLPYAPFVVSLGIGTVF